MSGLESSESSEGLTGATLTTTAECVLVSVDVILNQLQAERRFITLNQWLPTGDAP